MAGNKIQDGNILELAPDGGAVSGQAVMVGDIAAVACADIAEGTDGPCETRGVFSLPVTGHKEGDANAAIPAGSRIYYDGGELNLDATDGKPYGKVLAAVGAGATAEVPVLLAQ